MASIGFGNDLLPDGTYPLPETPKTSFREMCLKFHIQNKNLTSNGRIPNSALSAITSTDDLS